MEVMINQLERLCEVIAVGDYNPGIIFFNRDDYPLSLFYRVNLFFIYNDPDIKKAEKDLLLPGDDNMIRLRNIDRFRVSST